MILLLQFTYYLLSCHYYVIIMSLLCHYYVIITKSLLSFVTSLLRHYYVIITSLLQMVKSCNKESIITYYYIGCFHYNAIITYYYHYYLLIGYYYEFETGQPADADDFHSGATDLRPELISLRQGLSQRNSTGVTHI